MRIVLCKVCRNTTFRLVVPDIIPSGIRVQTVAECLECGEEAKHWSSQEDTMILTPKSDRP